MKNKKFSKAEFTALLIGCMILPSLTSCNGARVLEPEQVFTVSALGFDAQGETITAFAEVPTVLENEASDFSLKIIKGDGKSIEEAMDNLQDCMSKTPIFSHCAVLILGESLSENQQADILSFFADGLKIPLAAEVIFTTRSENLLACGNLSTPAAGYEISGILKQEQKKHGRFFCRLYELGDASSALQIPDLEPDPDSAKLYRLAGMRTIPRFFAGGNAV